MSWKIEYQEDMDIIRIENSGKVSLKEIQDQTIRGLELVREYNCKRCLSDCSAMQSELNTIEIHRIVTLYNDITMPHSIRIAVLLPTELTQQTRDDFQFYETIAVNQGYQVRLFTSRQMALDWLSNQKPTGLAGNG
jgi:hypothetical protein